MIKEIGVSQIVTYLARKSGKDYYECEYAELRRIGKYIETHDHSVRVELGERYYRSFRSRSVRHIIVERDRLLIDGINHPVMQAIIKQYAPTGKVAALIEEAIKESK